MKKIQKSMLLILSMIVFLANVTVADSISKMTRDKPKDLLSEIRTLLKEKKAEGYDVSKVLKLDKLSKEAFMSEDKEKGKQLLHEMLNALHELTGGATIGSDTLFDGNNVAHNSDLRLNKAFTTMKRAVEIDVPSFVENVICTYTVPETLPPVTDQEADFNSIFRQEILKVKNEKITIPLDERPVFIEIEKKSVENHHTPIQQDDNRSPFGIILHDELTQILKDNEKPLEDVVNAGVKWVRISGRRQIVWDLFEEGPLGNGKYNWKNFDIIVKALNLYKLNIFCVIHPFHRLDQNSDKPNGLAPKNMDIYTQFIQKVVERYDGDGKDDCPGSPIINAYQLHNEINVAHFWKDSPQAYAEMFKATYEAIKSANSSAKIVFGSASHLDGFFNSRTCSVNDALDELSKINGDADILDFHWYEYYGDYTIHPKGERKLKYFLEKELPESLFDAGFENLDVWFTEVGTYSGYNVMGRKGAFTPQNETEQAVELIRRYIYFTANGVKKIFWQGLIESDYSYLFGPNDFYNNIGVIYNGSGDDDLGKGTKKAAYYSYKLMTQKLNNVDWDNIEKIKEGLNGIYLYKFIGSDKKTPVWALWLDNSRI